MGVRREVNCLISGQEIYGDKVKGGNKKCYRDDEIGNYKNESD